MRPVLELGDASRAEIQAAVEGLTAPDAVYLKAHPSAPLLYSSGVRYRREPPGVERWKPIARVLADGVGDCEDLAAWRAAELRVRNREAARVVIVRGGGARKWHAVVKREDGRYEDPSRRLGMRREK